MIAKKRLGLSLIIALIATFLCPDTSAQRLALKTNAIDWMTLSPNLTLEARLSRRVSIQLGIADNPFNFTVADVKLKNFRVEPEVRYWFNRPMARHFVALSATAASLNLQFGDRRFVGDAVGAGISYGYALELSNQWNVEFELGAGLAHCSAYDYRGATRPAEKNYKKIVPVPIRAGVSFSYIFK